MDHAASTTTVTTAKPSTPNPTDPAKSQPASPVVTTGNLLDVAPSDPQHVVQFKQHILAALSNGDFLKDIKKVEKATASIKMPNPEDRVRAQLYVHAKKNLYAEAGILAEKGNPFVAPTEADIQARVEEGVKTWRKKQGLL